MKESVCVDEVPDVHAGVAAATVHCAMEGGSRGMRQQAEERQTETDSLHTCRHVTGGRA